MNRTLVALSLLALALLPPTAPLAGQEAGQDEVQDEVDVSFQDYDPPSTLVVPATSVPHAKFPFVDVHNHQWNMPEQDLAALAAEMDKLNMAVMVNLSGRGARRIALPDGGFRFGLGEEGHLAKSLANVEKNAPHRIVLFTNLDLDGFGSEGWSERAVAQLEADIAAGARGLKIYKGLGLSAKDIHGERIPVDAPGLDPIWAACGRLGVPVLIHTADPAPFWQAKDAQNERLYELIEKPRRYRGPEARPTWEELIAEQHAVFRHHPETTFISAHLGWMANDLPRLGKLLDELPNVNAEFGAVIAELGRQPRFARKWLTRYQDRILFGKDTWAPDEYETYFRVLETDDDYIKYFRRRHAFWRLYGLDLPDEVLKKIYYQNALRIVPGIDASLFPR